MARICTALAVYNKCASCPGAAPKPPLSAWHESTKSIVSFLGRASGRLRRWRAFRPQYRPLSRRCSVSQYSSSSFLCQVSVKRVRWWVADEQCPSFECILHAVRSQVEVHLGGHSRLHDRGLIQETFGMVWELRNTLGGRWSRRLRLPVDCPTNSRANRNIHQPCPTSRFTQGSSSAKSPQ